MVMIEAIIDKLMAQIGAPVNLKPSINLIDNEAHPSILIFDEVYYYVILICCFICLSTYVGLWPQNLN